MTISSRVQSSMFPSAELIRLPPTVLEHYEVRQMMHGEDHVPVRRVNLWSREEHERFLHALELCPKGPWKVIAAMVGTKTTRQAMTHAQKYRQKIARRKKLYPASLLPLLLPVVQVEQPLVTLTRLEPLVGEVFDVLPLPEQEEVYCPPAASAQPADAMKLLINNDGDLPEAPMQHIASPQEVSQVVDSSLFDLELDEFLNGLEPMIW